MQQKQRIPTLADILQDRQLPTLLASREQFDIAAIDYLTRLGASDPDIGRQAVEFLEYARSSTSPESLYIVVNVIATLRPSRGRDALTSGLFARRFQDVEFEGHLLEPIIALAAARYRPSEDLYDLMLDDAPTVDHVAAAMNIALLGDEIDLLPALDRTPIPKSDAELAAFDDALLLMFSRRREGDIQNWLRIFAKKRRLGAEAQQRVKFVLMRLKEYLPFLNESRSSIVCLSIFTDACLNGDFREAFDRAGSFGQNPIEIAQIAAEGLALGRTLGFYNPVLTPLRSPFSISNLPNDRRKIAMQIGYRQSTKANRVIVSPEQLRIFSDLIDVDVNRPLGATQADLTDELREMLSPSGN